ncbi:MAG: hypothetical protein IT428_15790 [Planctomycetaceae bacterium]|nr:hypothetical protein [Planctomycetaceae bacterium]
MPEHHTDSTDQNRIVAFRPPKDFDERKAIVVIFFLMVLALAARLARCW